MPLIPVIPTTCTQCSAPLPVNTHGAKSVICTFCDTEFIEEQPTITNEQGVNVDALIKRTAFEKLALEDAIKEYNRQIDELRTSLAAKQKKNKLFVTTLVIAIVFLAVGSFTLGFITGAIAAGIFYLDLQKRASQKKVINQNIQSLEQQKKATLNKYRNNTN